jgi:uncharacterized protein YceK
MKKISIVIVLTVAVALTGCSSWKKLIGKNDETILPGQREEILEPDKQTAKDPSVMSEQAIQQ